MASYSTNTTSSIIGTGIGAVVFVVLSAVLPSIWITLLIYAAVVLVGYIIGSFTLGNAVGEFFRGLLIGSNAALNWAVAAIVFPHIVGPALGAILPIVIAIVPLLSTIGTISRSPIYQGFLGYLNWVLPMSWPVVGAGLVLFIVGLLGGLIGLGGSALFKLERLAMEWKTGTLFTRGGWIANLNPIHTAFNMGNFAFVDTAHADMAFDHESGHTLNLASFGFVFHIIGAIDENVLKRGENALSECLAESHVQGSARPVLSMWAV